MQGPVDLRLVTSRDDKTTSQEISSSTSSHGYQTAEESPTCSTVSLYSELSDTSSISSKQPHKEDFKTFNNFITAHSELTSDQQEEAVEFRNLPAAKKRATSLKTLKTPPGTPNPKAVRFADAFGLDLACVKMVMNSDDPPEIPPEAMQDLVLPSPDQQEASNSMLLAALTSTTVFSQKLLISPCFLQPGLADDFLERVLKQKIVLEHANQASESMISGVLCVANVAFNKTVFVRVTFNRWASSLDIPAAFKAHEESAGDIDRFTFAFYVPFNFKAGDEIYFCACMQTDSGEFWDNNFGGNYMFDCCGV